MSYSKACCQAVASTRGGRWRSGERGVRGMTVHLDASGSLMYSVMTAGTNTYWILEIYWEIRFKCFHQKGKRKMKQYVGINMLISLTIVITLHMYVTYTLVSSFQPLSCVRLCDPMDCSSPGLPVHHQLPEFTQTHIHWVSDTIQPSHPLLSPSPPAFNLSQHQGLFQWVRSSHQVAKVLEFQIQHQSFQRTPRTDFL